jgi:hypothetical protein
MLAEAARVAANTVVQALEKASAATGVDFNYLLGTAIRESGLKAGAKSKNSSASGLFQFVEQTWLSLVKEFGAKHGLASYANAIQKGENGRYRAIDAADRSAILRLRNDPQISALMAGEYAKQTEEEMEGSLGRKVSSGELYAAHLLGPSSACKLIRTNQGSPGTAACDLFPRAADANPHIFYHADGTPKSVHEVYSWTVKAPLAVTPVVKLDKSALPDVPSVSTGVLDTHTTAALLASMWTRPHKNVFETDENSTPAATPFLATPAILDILQTVANDRHKK